MTGRRRVGDIAPWLALSTGILIIPMLITSRYDMGVMLLALINVLLVLGFNFTIGFTRRLSLGHIGFFAIGAYATGLLTTQYNLSPLFAMLLGVCVACFAALILSALTNGLQAHYLTLATLGFGQVVQIVATNWIGLTGGSNGVAAVPPFSILGFAFDDPRSQYFLMIGFLALGSLFTYRFMASKTGRDAFALRQSEIAAQSLGIRTDHVKTVTLAISAAFGSVAGSLYAHIYGYVAPDAFSFALMLTVLAMLVVGGSGSIAGPVVGAMILTYVPEVARIGDQYWQLVYGTLLFAMVLWAPKGVVGLFKSLEARLWRREQDDREAIAGNLDAVMQANKEAR